MKSKKLHKKLALNKKIIAHLNDGNLKHVYGGITIPLPTTGPILPGCRVTVCETVCNSNPCC